tara:strand:+ start:74 stop:610 length:537 start_codon:yes stop_codon:yes gene_type:complete
MYYKKFFNKKYLINYIMNGLDIHKVPFVFFQNNDKSKQYSEMLKKHVLNESASHTHLLSSTFYSKENMDLINKGITLTVFKVTNGEFYIGKQSDKHLTIAMRAIYHEHARHLPYNIKGQVSELNRKVIKSVVPGIVTNLQQYIGYVRDASSIPDPLDRPLNVNNLDRTLPSISNIYQK